MHIYICRGGGGISLAVLKTQLIKYSFMTQVLTQIQRLQLIQNSAARLVTRTKKYDSITSVLRNLHWLPIQSRINFKVLLFAYQCFHKFGPSYLVELLTQYKPERTLYQAVKCH